MIKRIGIFLISLMFLSSFVGAAEDTFTQNPTSLPHKRTVQRLFKAYEVSSVTYDYDSSGGGAVTDGIIWMESFWDASKIVQMKITITAVTSIEVVVEGMLHPDLGSWSELWVKSFTASTDTNKDYIALITEDMWLMRIGVKYTGGAPGVGDLASITWFAEQKGD